MKKIDQKDTKRSKINHGLVSYLNGVSYLGRTGRGNLRRFMSIMERMVLEVETWNKSATKPIQL